MALFGHRAFALDTSTDQLTADDVTIDAGALADLIRDVFLLSMDGRLTPAAQGTLNAQGVTLRLQLRALLGVLFDGGIAELQQANAQIKLANTQLKEAKKDIDKLADGIENIGRLVGALNSLLGLVGAVI